MKRTITSRTITSRTKASIVATALSSLLIVTPPAMAQGDWLDSVKSFLGMGDKTADAPLTDAQTVDGVKQLLTQSVQSMVAKLGQSGSFDAGSDLHIDFPQSLQGVKSALEKAGMGDYVTQIEQKINQAAAGVIPKVAPVLKSSISNLNIEDAKSIYEGGSEAATQYLKNTMGKPIADALTPIVKQSLTEAGAMEVYNSAMEKYNALPFLPKADGDLIGLVQSKATDAIFTYMGQEEAAIRQDPSQASDLLKQMFGG